MPAKTQPTAAELRAQLAQREAEERDLADRKRAARKAAEIKACEELLADPASELAAANNAAYEAWNAAVDDPSVGLEELFRLFQARRLSSSRRAQFVAQATAVWDALEPLRHPTSGQPVQHRVDTLDPLEPRGSLAFAEAIEQVLARRAAAVASESDRKVLTTIADASDRAAAEVK